MNVVPFKRRGGEPPREEPHIDLESLGKLLGVFMDLSDYLKHEHDLDKHTELYGLTRRLGDTLLTLTKPTQPPKGAP